MKLLEKQITPPLLAISVIAFAAASVHADGYDAYAYVTNGLVAQWDGIDNVGTGSHDATATTWKDLSGNGHDAVRKDGAALAWADGNSMKRTGTSGNTVVMVTDMTMNFDSLFTLDFCGVQPTMAQAYFFHFVPTTAGKSQSSFFVNGSWQARVSAAAKDCNSGNNFYTGGSLVTIRDGKTTTHYNTTQGTSFVKSNVGVGKEGDVTGTLYLASQSSGSSSFLGNFRALRIYNRALTDAERSWNTAVDQVRFDGAPTGEAKVLVSKLKETYGLTGTPALGSSTSVAFPDDCEFSLSGLSEHPDDGALSREYATGCRARFHGWSFADSSFAVRTVGAETNCTVAVTNSVVMLEWDVRNELKLSASARTGGKVRLAGGAAAASDLFWAEEDVSVAVEAVPDAGYEFVSWTGDLKEVGSVTSAVTTCCLHAPATISAFFRETSHTPVTLNWKSDVLSGDFNDPDCWAEGAVPGAGDTLYITNCTTKAVTITIDVPTPRLGRLVISNGGGSKTTTLKTKNWTTCVAADTIEVGAGGVITTTGGFTEQTMSNRVWLAGNTLTVAAGGLIDVRRCGYTGGGPCWSKAGASPHYLQGGVYGGGFVGSSGNGIYPIPYGNAEWPTDPGSAPSKSGGGAIRLDFAGLVRIDGTVTADGESRTDYYGTGTSGGSVLIVCDRITGSGEVLARSRDKLTMPSYSGDLGQVGGGSGGGRIAVHYAPASQAAVTDCTVRFDSSSSVCFDPRPQVGYGRWSTFPMAAEDNITLMPPGTLWMPDATLLRAASYRASGWKFGGQWVSPEPVGDLVFDAPIRFDQCGLFLPSSCSNFTVLAGMTLTGSGPYARRDMGLFLSNTVVTVTGNINASGARFELCGGSLTVNGNVNLTENDYTYSKFPCRFNGGEVAVKAAATNGTDNAYGATVRVTGSVNVSTNSTFYLGCHPKDGAIVYMSAKRMTVDRGGKVSSENGGWAAYSGPGKGKAYSPAASHGGRGCPTNSVNTAATYGSLEEPVEPGSGAALCGGGVVRLDIDRVLTLNGEINADASRYVGGQYSSAGAGGSVYVRVPRLAGSGFFSAAGGLSDQSSYSFAGGGGGRVAVWTRGTANWTGAATAEGGYKQASSALALLEEKRGEDGTVHWHNLPGSLRIVVR